MKTFELELSTKIYFGTNIYEEAIDKIGKLLPERILLVTTGRSLKRNGYVDQIVQCLKTKGNVEEVIIFDQVSPNPRLEEAKKAVRLGKEKKVLMGKNPQKPRFRLSQFLLLPEPEVNLAEVQFYQVQNIASKMESEAKILLRKLRLSIVILHGQSPCKQQWKWALMCWHMRWKVMWR